MGASIGLKLDYCALQGTGAGEPKGITNQDTVNEIAVGGTLSNAYDEVVAGMVDIMDNNGLATGWCMTPAVFEAFETLADAAGNPIQVQASVERLKREVSNQVPTGYAILGDYSQVLYGVRKSIELKMAEAGAGSGSEAFSRNQVLIRAIVRADVAILRPTWFTKLTGIS